MKNRFQTTGLLLLAFALTVTGCDTDGEVPLVHLQDLILTLDENPDQGDSIGTVQTDTPTSNYGITAQTPEGALSIDPNTGELSIADAQLFDFETNPTLTAYVSADNADGQAIITIELNDLFESTIPGATQTEFVVGPDAYVTPKAYLLVDDASIDGEFDREFTFVFTDGELIEDTADEIAFETTTTVFTKVTCNLIATKPTLTETPFFTWDPQTNPNGFVSIVMSGDNYSRFGIANFSNTYSIGNQTFGQASDGTLHQLTALPQGSGTGNLLTINSRTFDLNTMSGTIDCSYSYTDDTGLSINGVFVGTYEILTAF